MVRALAAAVMVLLALNAGANELLVDVRTLQMNDLATVTLSLEGDFAEAGEPNVPLRNLRFVGEPSVSSEFAWINGRVSRRKVFQYRVRPVAPGSAQVGPVVLTTKDGQRDTLNAIALQVNADRIAASNDAERVLRDLLAGGRPALFVVAEADRTNVVAGEPIVVTWHLYNAAAIQEWQVIAVPKLADFWIEELPRGESAERAYVGETMVQRLAIRRAILFPLRSGRIEVEGMTIEAAVMEQTRGGPFAMFEGALVEAAFTSAPFTVDVHPLPPGPPVDVVGDVALRCEPPVQRNAGPVVVRVSLEGLGNLRAAPAPRFEQAVAGDVKFDAGPVSVVANDGNVAMSRQWEILIFPSSRGPLRIPALSMQAFVPRTGERRELRCASGFIDVLELRPPAARPAAPAPPPGVSRRVGWPWIVAGIALFAVLVLAFPRIRRTLALHRETREIVRDAGPAEIRARMERRVHIDPREASDRGDAWRALLSLLDAAERGRDIATGADDEIARRVRDVLRFVNSSPPRG